MKKALLITVFAILTFFATTYLTPCVQAPKAEDNIRFAEVAPVGRTEDGNGMIFSDAEGNGWALNNFYADPEDRFLIALDNCGTDEIDDDEIVDIWLALE